LAKFGSQLTNANATRYRLPLNMVLNVLDVSIASVKLSVWATFAVLVY